MDHPKPFYLETGAGPGVVCLHSNASTSGQWRKLMELLAPKFHMLAVDSYGAGKSPAWPHDRSAGLRDEVALIEPVLQRAGDPFTLVAHSYGAAVALLTAIQHPQRVRALALYEPTLFSLLEAERPSPNEADGIRNAAGAAAKAFAAGDLDSAARHFIDFWMTQGAWDSTPDARKPAVAGSMINIQNWKRGLFEEPTPLSRFAELKIPVLYMIGRDSPASSRGVARLLTRTLPQVEVIELHGLGHMGPVTHPDTVNPLISTFLDRHHPQVK